MEADGDPGTTDRDDAKMQLLSELHRGRPVSDLIPLLVSDDAEIVEVGIWVASELGALGAPLLPTVVPLLDHSDPTVRFFALDCVLLWASAADGEALARAVALVGDSSSAVRWKAMRFLWRASAAQLAAAREIAPPPHAELVSWLLDPSRVVERLESDDALERRYAAVAAARLAPSDPRPLNAAAHSADPEVREFVADLGVSRG